MLKKTLASRMGGPLSNGYTMNGENVITNGKLPTKKFTEMAPLLFYSITTVSRATTHISLKRIGSFSELRASGIKANLSKDKINMLFLGLRDPMNTKTISTIISIPTILQNGIDYTYEQIQKVSLEYRQTINASLKK
jgi:hypothetical protein